MPKKAATGASMGVKRSNMTKQFGVRTGVGKAYRGTGYEPPRIGEVLEAHRERSREADH